MNNLTVLWICNKKPAQVSTLLNCATESLGGWLDWTCERLTGQESLKLCVMFPDYSETDAQFGNLKVSGFLENRCFERFMKVFSAVNPDVIHIWGTEFSHSNAAMKAAESCGISDRCVISVQGLVSLYGKYHYTEGLPVSVVKRYTLRDFIRHNRISDARNGYITRGKDEIEAIRRAKHIIGRTDWDKAAAEMFNSDAEYHFCNESLRDSFYNFKWSIESAERHRIFASQSNYPIKGFHYLLEAMPEILKKYPDAHIYTTGKDILNLSKCSRFKMTSYQKYIMKLIIKNGLQNQVTFLGTLSEKQMCEQYLKANVFVSPSTIENSPNSVGEAMLVGCPVVASDVGGVKNMITHGTEGYVYQSSAPYMLAYYVKRIFADDATALGLSIAATKHAAKTHDRENNFSELLKIYTEILSGVKEKR